MIKRGDIVDRIDTSIKKNLHITKNSAFIGKTWNDFETAVQNKKLLLYGLNDLLNFFWMRCEKKFSIVAAIDNNVEKQGHTLEEFYDEIYLPEAKDIVISPKKELINHNPDEVVILISSYRYYEEIAKELDDNGYHCYFSVLHVEIEYRKYMTENHLPYEDRYEYISNYAKECVEKYPIQNNKVVVSMSTHIDHGKYITKQLLLMNKDIDIVWIVSRLDLKVPEGVRIVYTVKSKQYIYEMETAKIWVYGIHVSSYIIKREEQKYIQTKHWGSFLLKKVSLAHVRHIAANRKMMEMNSKWMDYIVSGSEFDEETCRISFDFKGKFLRFGSPKSDILFSGENYKEKVYKQFNLNLNDRVLIYAPTYRSDAEKNFNDFKWLGLDFDILLKALQEKWPGSWKIFLRLHPQVRTRSKLIEKPNFVIDVSEYEDSEELVAASDVMISDYSTIMIESAYIMRPVFLFAPDKETYINHDRELFIDYDSLPFPISMTNEELASQIKGFDENIYNAKVKKFLEEYGLHEDGHASERTAKFIIKLMYDGK